VSVEEKDWLVERYLQDFRNLRRQLEKLNPGYLLPPIHDFTIDKEMRPDLVNDTKEMLQNFLDGVLVHPFFGSTELVYYFLCSKHNNKTEDKFYYYLKINQAKPKPRHVKDMHRDNGIGVISLTKDINANINSLRKSSDKLKELYQE
jgi:hypothetical protein